MRASMNTLQAARQASDAAAQRRAEQILALLRRASAQVFGRAAGAEAIARFGAVMPRGA